MANTSTPQLNPVPSDFNLFLAKNGRTRLNNDQPAAPSGYQNVSWQQDQFGNISACVPSGGGLAAPVHIPTLLSTNVGLEITGAAGSGGMVAQSFSAAYTSNTIFEPSFPQFVTAGNLLVVCAAINTETGQVATVSDSLRNTWTLQTSDGGDPNNFDNMIYTCIANSSGVCNLRLTFDSAGIACVGLLEINGSTNTQNNLDFCTNTPISNPLIAVGPDTLTASSCEIAILVTDSNATFTSNTGATLQTSVQGEFMSIALFTKNWEAGSATPSYNVVGADGTFFSGQWTYQTNAVGQTADLQQWQNPDGTPLSSVNNIGQVVLATTSGEPTNTPDLGGTAFDPATNKLWIYGSAGWKSTTLS